MRLRYSRTRVKSNKYLLMAGNSNTKFYTFANFQVNRGLRNSKEETEAAKYEIVKKPFGKLFSIRETRFFNLELIYKNFRFM